MWFLVCVKIIVFDIMNILKEYFWEIFIVRGLDLVNYFGGIIY